MELSKKLCLGIIGFLLIVGVLFFVDKQYFISNQDETDLSLQSKPMVRDLPPLIQEAKTLLGDGYKAQDPNLAHQAIDKYSIWLKQNLNSSDKKRITDVLIVRANAFLWLKMPKEAIRDFKKSIEYNPSGTIQSGICMIEKEQGNLSILHNCYAKAVEFYKNKKVSKTDQGFLIARILSGDRAAITDYKNVFDKLTGDERWIYGEAAKSMFDNATYKEITGKDCIDCGNFQFFK